MPDAPATKIFLAISSGRAMYPRKVLPTSAGLAQQIGSLRQQFGKLSITGLYDAYGGIDTESTRLRLSQRTSLVRLFIEAFNRSQSGLARISVPGCEGYTGGCSCA